MADDRFGDGLIGSLFRGRIKSPDGDQILIPLEGGGYNVLMPDGRVEPLNPNSQALPISKNSELVKRGPRTLAQDGVWHPSAVGSGQPLPVRYLSSPTAFTGQSVSHSTGLSLDRAGPSASTWPSGSDGTGSVTSAAAMPPLSSISMTDYRKAESVSNPEVTPRRAPQPGTGARSFDGTRLAPTEFGPVYGSGLQGSIDSSEINSGLSDGIDLSHASPGHLVPKPNILAPSPADLKTEVVTGKGAYHEPSEDEKLTAAGDIFMDRIAAKESTSNYNAVGTLEGEKLLHPDQDLRGKTFSQVYSWQHLPENTKTTTDENGKQHTDHRAVGFLQFKSRTLKDIATKLGLWDAPYTPENQRKVGLELLKEAKLAKNLRGEISNDDFSRHMHNTWEVVPPDDMTQTLMKHDDWYDAVRATRRAYETAGRAPNSNNFDGNIEGGSAGLVQQVLLRQAPPLDGQSYWRNQGFRVQR